MITKDMPEWKKEDEEKQYATFSESMDIEFEKDAELSTMQHIQMAFFPIIAHEHYYLVVFNLLKDTSVIIDNLKSSQTYDTKYKQVCDLLRKLFSRHLEEYHHPKVIEVLTKKPTIIRPKWATKDNATDYGNFLMMHMERYYGEIAKN
ncbi:ulp1 protease family, C-terminal catalytic domain-containing protein [Tanacetum coccineum]|uniref:Ulp1 protease family, C-terminal catalytic domain-containing protein n=1 Tax=Tanacetum coccineum TaxID=301880 RepID=A0ABQ5IP33_9ASTR